MANGKNFLSFLDPVFEKPLKGAKRISAGIEKARSDISQTGTNIRRQKLDKLLQRRQDIEARLAVASVREGERANIRSEKRRIKELEADLPSRKALRFVGRAAKAGLKGTGRLIRKQNERSKLAGERARLARQEARLNRLANDTRRNNTQRNTIRNVRKGDGKRWFRL